MTIYEFAYTTIGSSSLIATITFLARNIIIERLKNAVKHEYDLKLAENKKQIDIDIKNIESQLDTNKSITTEIAKSNISKLHIFKEKQIFHIDLLWETITKIEMLVPGVFTMADQIPHQHRKDFFTNPTIAQIAKNINTTEIADFLKSSNVNTSQLYVSEILWAKYQAYLTIISIALTRTETLISKDCYDHWHEQYTVFFKTVVA
jgi:hypothetical protein